MTPLSIAPWPPCGAITTLPLAIGPGICSKHGLPQFVHAQVQAIFSLHIVAAAALLLATPGATAVAGPFLCCLLGDEAMEGIHRAIPAVWALRN